MLMPEIPDGPLDVMTRSSLFIAACRTKTHVHTEHEACAQCLHDMVFIGTHGLAILSQLNRAEEQIAELEARLAVAP